MYYYRNNMKGFNSTSMNTFQDFSVEIRYGLCYYNSLSNYSIFE